MFRDLRAKAYPVGMLLVGMAFIPLGLLRYPVFLIAGLLYAYIGFKGLRK